MDGKLVERLDKQRYRAVSLEAVGLLLVFLESLWFYIANGFEPEMYQLVIGGFFFGLLPGSISPGLIILIGGGIWYGLIYRKIRRDQQVKRALYNEMYQDNKRRYQRMSLWIMIGVAIVSMFIAPLSYPHVIVTEMIVFAGLLTMKILWLVYNRR